MSSRSGGMRLDCRPRSEEESDDGWWHGSPFPSEGTTADFSGWTPAPPSFPRPDFPVWNEEPIPVTVGCKWLHGLPVPPGVKVVGWSTHDSPCSGDSGSKSGSNLGSKSGSNPVSIPGSNPGSNTGYPLHTPAMPSPRPSGVRAPRRPQPPPSTGRPSRRPLASGLKLPPPKGPAAVATVLRGAGRTVAAAKKVSDDCEATVAWVAQQLHHFSADRELMAHAAVAVAAESLVRKEEQVRLKLFNDGILKLAEAALAFHEHSGRACCRAEEKGHRGELRRAGARARMAAEEAASRRLWGFTFEQSLQLLQERSHRHRLGMSLFRERMQLFRSIRIQLSAFIGG
eukprot:Hpha_TRINITY_DN16562_c6_g2::TRINITY_DN16562_c6_g2_i1::g.134138::m.134138